jgi:hypothetical protein
MGVLAAAAPYDRAPRNGRVTNTGRVLNLVNVSYRADFKNSFRVVSDNYRNAFPIFFRSANQDGGGVAREKQKKKSRENFTKTGATLRNPDSLRSRSNML